MAEIKEQYKCCVEGCNSYETVLDYDGKWYCQKHLAEKIFKSAPKIKLGPNDICFCGSGEKHKDCCAKNPLKMWFVKNVGRMIYYYDKACTLEKCEECERGRKGIRVANLKHALDLYDFSSNNNNMFFTNDPERVKNKEK